MATNHYEKYFTVSKYSASPNNDSELRDLFFFPTSPPRLFSGTLTPGKFVLCRIGASSRGYSRLYKVHTVSPAKKY